MGMSIHIVGIKPPDERWRKMKAIWDACIEAHVEVPRGVEKFFGYDIPDRAGVVIDLKEEHEVVREWAKDMAEGYEVDLSKLPPDIKTIRFYNSW